MPFSALPQRALTRPAAERALRAAFMGVFGLQVAFALLCGGLLRLVAPPQSGSALLGAALVGLGIAQLPLALLLGNAHSRPGGWRAALSATILAAVLLATPAWFAALALAVAAPLPYLLALCALLAGYAVIGVVLIRRYAGRALEPPPTPSQPPGGPDDPQL